MFKKKYTFLYLVFIFFSFSSITVFGQKKFTIVIDPGHGGKDPGAITSRTMEKNLNLAVALKLGKKIEENNPDVNVQYTRKTDVYLTVAERPKFANDVHADLFISIHTNSSSRPDAQGVETYTLGYAKTKENLDVAMTENSVILLEDDYKKTYQGFDPTSIESYIMFEFMQDKYIEHSIQFSSLVQNQLINNCNRKNRGVRQAGFLVLKNTAMPSVLIEIGFLSNVDEEKYLNSNSGQEELATGIYNAFLSFKHEFDKKSNSAASSIIRRSQDSTYYTEAIIEQDSVIISSEPVYKVQILVRKELLSESDPIFKGLEGIEHYYENELYKYTYKASTDYKEIRQYQKEISDDFKGTFIVTFINGKKVTLK